jgi:hypothetical protein
MMKNKVRFPLAIGSFQLSSHSENFDIIHAFLGITALPLDQDLFGFCGHKSLNSKFDFSTSPCNTFTLFIAFAVTSLACSAIIAARQQLQSWLRSSARLMLRFCHFFYRIYCRSQKFFSSACSLASPLFVALSKFSSACFGVAFGFE